MNPAHHNGGKYAPLLGTVEAEGMYYIPNLELKKEDHKRCQ